MALGRGPVEPIGSRCGREMLNRFAGKNGRRLLVEALASQKLVLGDRALAEELAKIVEVLFNSCRQRSD